MIKPLLEGRSHRDLYHMLGTLSNTILPSGPRALWEEVFSLLPDSKACQYDKLNKGDLLLILYMILAPEIREIDGADRKQLALMVNRKWSIPELRERYLARLRGDA